MSGLPGTRRVLGIRGVLGLRRVWMGAILTAAGVAALPAATVAAPSASPAMRESATTVRLSPSQYRQTIADVFDSSIRIEGRFEPEQREQGLLAIGARIGNFTDSGIESYNQMARSIAAQVVDTRHRGTLIGCKPHSETASDDACARAFFERAGPVLYRRPLTADELQRRVSTAAMAADKLHDFYSGLRLSLTEMLISPNFLWRTRFMEPDPKRPGEQRMNAWSKAAELSYFLWNTTPDRELMRAAASGELDTQAGLERQVDRLLRSPRVADALNSFFADMLGFSEFESVSKDPAYFPRYTPTINEQAQEQTLRTIVDHIVIRRGDYRDIFTTPHTFLTMDLAALYQVPLTDRTDNGQPQRWVAHTYEADDPRVGILAEASFTTLWSPSARTSPTARGKALRQHLLCQTVPPPPGNVSFNFVNDTKNPEYKTTRERLMAHRTDAVCAGCHRLTDPIGFALENFDSAGEFRTTENGAPIDATGELNGGPFVGSTGLAKAVHDDPAVAACVAQRAFAFETGFMPGRSDPKWQQIQQSFASSHYDVLALMRAIAVSELSYRVPGQALTAATR